jgi:hypothetical protein
MSKSVPKTAPTTSYQQQGGTADSDKVFLEKNNVKGILNDLLEALNHHRPEDPLIYIYNQ